MITDIELQSNNQLVKTIVNEAFGHSNKILHISVSFCINGLPVVNRDPMYLMNLLREGNIDTNIIFVHLSTRLNENRVRVLSGKISLLGNTNKEKLDQFILGIDAFCKQNFHKEFIEIQEIIQGQDGNLFSEKNFGENPQKQRVF